jgi:gliding motility-associated-like protein
MKKALIFICCATFFILIVTEKSNAQVVFYSDQFYGGVTTGAYSIGTAPFGTGSFNVNIPAGSTIHKAWFFATRTGVNAPAITVQLNGINCAFNSTNQVGTNFNGLYGGASANHVIDVTSLISPATVTYTITVPNQATTSNKFTEFLLYIAYDNPSLSQVTSYIYLNELDCQAVMNYNFNTTNPINTNSHVGFSICAGYSASNLTTDCEEVNVNGTSLGIFYGSDFNAASIFGSTGTFEYFNGTLNGLGDDDENQAILGPDVLSDIKNLIPNNTTTFAATLTHCPAPSLLDNMIWMFFLTYSSDTCGPSGLNLGPDTTICPGSSLILNATTPNAIYTWQDGSSNPTYNVTQPGIYTVDVNVNGCHFIDSIAVAGIPFPIVELGNDTALCQGDSLTLDVTILNGTYLWQDNSTNPIYTISQTGTYIVNVSNICSSVTDSISVVINPLPVVTLGNDTTLCAGQSVLLDVTQLNASYIWQNGSTTNTFNVTSSGTYFVEVTISGCSSSDTININYTPLPFVSLGNDTSLCQGQTLTLDVTIPNGTYLWSDNSTNPVYTIVQSGTYAVNVSNSCGVVSDSILVNVFPYPNFYLGNDTTLCAGQSLLLDATVLNGTYLWFDNSTNPTFLVTQPGSYLVQVSTNGCTAADSIEVSYNPIPVVELGNDTTLCQGQSIILNATTSNSTYLWSNNTTLPTLTVTQSGTYAVAVTSNGCTGVDSVAIVFNPIPVINIGPDISLCSGESLLLDAFVNGGTYLWSDNSTNSSLLISQAGIYSVQVTVNGCSGFDTVTVTYLPLPVVNLGNDLTICQGQSVTLDATTPNADYLWSDNSTASTITANQAGLYWVQVTVNGCSGGDSVNVFVNALPIVDLGNNSVNCTGDILVLDATTTGASYLWPNNSSNATFSVNQTGVYWVQVTLNNCSATDSVYVLFDDCAIILEVPNIITPNNDGLNDFFTPTFSKNVVAMKTKIFNRWGKQIFSTDNPLIDWDGKSGNIEVVDGVYFYVIEFTDKKNNRYFKKGTLTIKR